MFNVLAVVSECIPPQVFSNTIVGSAVEDGEEEEGSAKTQVKYEVVGTLSRFGAEAPSWVSEVIEVSYSTLLNLAQPCSTKLFRTVVTLSAPSVPPATPSFTTPHSSYSTRL